VRAPSPSDAGHYTGCAFRPEELFLVQLPWVNTRPLSIKQSLV